MSRRSKENPEGLKIFDSHCHLTDGQFAADLPAVLKQAHSAGVRWIMVASQSVPDSRQAVALCRNREGLYCAVGVHPHETAFHAQVELARMLDMPMIVHIRDAAGRARGIIDEHGYYSGVLHCFSSDKKLAEWAAEKRIYVSFAGNITYGEERYEDIARMIPRDRLMVETDAPYLAPAPSRGQRNEPALIRSTVEKLAQILGISSVEVADLTRENALNCFRI
jgi:TatD DNase family protein